MKIGVVTTQRAKSELKIFGLNLRQQLLYGYSHVGDLQLVTILECWRQN